MGEKLYPPYLENTIPAFYKTKTGAVIKVPFSMNRIVSLSEVDGFSLLVKSVATGEVLFTAEGTIDQVVAASDSTYKNNIATFNISVDKAKNKLRIGQFYKVQLAYIQDTEIGWYSNASIAKCTILPTLSIDGLTAGTINYIQNSYVGTYQLKQAEAGVNIPSEDKDNLMWDISERVLTYSFTVTDYSGNVLQKVEDVHNTSEDDMTLEKTKDSFKLNFFYEPNKVYYLTYSVKTINGLELNSNTYKIMDRETINMDYDLSLTADCYPENGFIKVNIINNINPETQKKDTIAGSFIISRRSAPYVKETLVSHKIKKISYNWTPWQEIWDISLKGTVDYDGNLKDFTVEQGRVYQYCIQQYNDYNIYSNRVESNVCKADFEYMFLYDGAHQLKIKYNPTVLSFKNTVLESKIDTIGSKHPFIFRNGDVKYKEFPIGGLISYLMDGDITYSSTGVMDNERFYFFNPEDLRNNEKTLKRMRTKSLRTTDFPFQRNTNLTADNTTVERMFKLTVLDWLNDGNPKLFRTPTEGNYVVRLLNVSLTPVNELGRMIHSFQAQAYEIADFNYDTLKNFDFFQDAGLELRDWAIRSTLLWQKDDNTEVPDGDEYRLKHRKETNILGDDAEATMLDFHDVTPGTFLQIDNKIIRIGQSGTYHLEPDSPVKSVIVLSPDYLYGSLDYAFKVTPIGTNFSKLKKIRSYDAANRQRANNTGGRAEMMQYLQSFDDNNRPLKVIQHFTNLKFTLRPIYDLAALSKVYDYQPILMQNDNQIILRNTSFTLSNDVFSLDPWGIFKYGNNYYVWDNRDINDVANDTTLTALTSYVPNVIITVLKETENNQPQYDTIDLDLTRSPVLEIKDLDNVVRIELGSGVVMDCSYLGIQYEYVQEGESE